MQRSELEHIIRAAGSIVNSRVLMVVGSQSILGQFPEAPEVLLRSIEADIYPKDDPAGAEIIEGAIGEESPFHVRFGYYAHGVGPETVIVPPDFESRLVEIKNENTKGYVGACLEVHDLTVSKLAAGREKDFEFVVNLLMHRLIDPSRIESMIKTLGAPDRQSLVMDRLHRLQRQV